MGQSIGSRSGRQFTTLQQQESSAAIPLPFDQLEAMHLAFYLSVAPGQTDRSAYRRLIPQQGVTKALDFWQTGGKCVLCPGWKAFLSPAAQQSPEFTDQVVQGCDFRACLDEPGDALARLDRDMPLTNVRTMDQIVIDSMSESRTQTWFIGPLASVSVLMAALGVYGVMSYSVAQGTHDMGIRMALGASAGDALALVLRKGLLLTAVGLAAGLAGAFGLTCLLSSLLFNIKPTDPWTFITVSLLLALVALAAGYIPAWRATRIDPVEALRFE